MRIFLRFLSGLVFGLGLIVSGMADPAKVLNVLDLAGSWDPSLAFVMGGATITAFIGYRLGWRRRAPALGGSFDIPLSRSIDRPLLTGAALFGIGSPSNAPATATSRTARRARTGSSCATRVTPPCRCPTASRPRCRSICAAAACPNPRATATAT